MVTVRYRCMMKAMEGRRCGDVCLPLFFEHIFYNEHLLSRLEHGDGMSGDMYVTSSISPYMYVHSLSPLALVVVW